MILQKHLSVKILNSNEVVFNSVLKRRYSFKGYATVSVLRIENYEKKLDNYWLMYYSRIY